MTEETARPEKDPGSGKASPRAGEERESAYARAALLIIIVFSAALGLACVIQYMRSPFFTVPMIDEEAYVNWARKIVEGPALGTEVFYQDPLYPYFLAALFKIFGESLYLVRLLQVAMGAATVCLVFWTARKLMGFRTALLAAAIMAGYGGLYFFELLILKAAMVMFLSALCCALGVAAAARPGSSGRFFLAGVTLGLLTLLRGNFLAIAPLLLLWAFFVDRESGRGRRLLRALVLAGGFVLVILPVTARNYRVSGEVVITTSQAGANFFIGNNEAANGQYVVLPFVRAHPDFQADDFRSAAERRLGRSVTGAEASRYWLRQGLSWIRSNPGTAARLWLRKARLLVHNFETPNNHSFYAIRKDFVPALRIPALGFGLLWGPALWGAAALLWRDRRASFPALFALLYLLSLIPFFILARYRVAAVPAMAVFGAAFFAWIYKEFRAGRVRSAALAATWLAASAALGLAPTIESKNPMFGYEYYLAGNACVKKGDPARAIAWYGRAIEGMADDEAARKAWAGAVRDLGISHVHLLRSEAAKEARNIDELFEIGERLYRLGEPAPAIEVYRMALDRDPDYFPAHARLGELYATGRGVRDLKKALDHLGRAAVMRPDIMKRREYIDALFGVGELYFMDGDTLRARQWWDQVLDLDPVHRGALKNLHALEEMGR